MLAFANAAVMGASDTCTQIEMLAACSLFTGTESYDCYYSTDGGSSWSSATSVSVTSVDPKYRWVKATFSGLALTQTQVNALQVKMTRTGSGGGTACTSLCAIITFSAEFIPRPQHQKPLAILRM
jgi:hypothetical protein